jgi:hypothetical protein
MAGNLVLDRFDNSLCGSRTLIIFDCRSSSLLSRTDNLQGREAFDVHTATERLVLFFIAINSSDFGNAIKRFGSFLIGGFQTLAVTTPRSIKSGRGMRWIDGII